MTDNKLLCITHQMSGVASCVRRGVHTADCEREGCEGCVAKEAQHGFVCGACWQRLEAAISLWDYEFFPSFANEVRAVQPEGGGARSPGATVPLSALQLTIDEILRLQKSRTVARLWVTTPAGAEDAVRFTRAVERAARTYPRKEGERKIPTTRCPACGRRTLVYDPAQAVGADARVRCLNPECGNVMDHTSFERIALIEGQCCRRCRSNDEGCTDTGCTCHRLAPVPEWQRTNKPSDEHLYDPTSREDADLDPLTILRLAELRDMAWAMEIPRWKQLRKSELIAAIRAVETTTGSQP